MSSDGSTYHPDGFGGYDEWTAGGVFFVPDDRGGRRECPPAVLEIDVGVLGGGSRRCLTKGCWLSGRASSAYVMSS
ncbi:hypothetical protein CEXT_444541 [Caerostris extrusa]|uniref:Uncharacterized protein n=1 Tax=Caerostris extrusa TaxID=172846 RepID=A0AAV4T0Y3_CAEEX|nr:hypothetical protein CEXT_444541 [Caerostris extrusa]